MTNKVSMRGDVAHIELNGKYKAICLVDGDSLKKISAAGNSIRGSKTKDGNIYATLWVRGDGNYSLHRFLTGAERGQVVDHINHNTLDNRLCNLRVVSNRDNNLNRSRSTAKSGLRGVCMFRGKYRSKFDGRWLGDFETEREAVRAVRVAMFDAGVPIGSIIKTTTRRTA